MKSFKQFIAEAGIVNMERYIRAHGKRPRSDGSPANYMFCSKRFGEPDHNDAKQVFAINATWNDAKKAVTKWAKENKLSSVYMMEKYMPDPNYYYKVTSRDGTIGNFNSKEEAREVATEAMKTLKPGSMGSVTVKRMKRRDKDVFESMFMAAAAVSQSKTGTKGKGKFKIGSKKNPENAEAEASNRKKQTGKNGKVGLPAAKNTAKSGQNDENAEAEAANRKKQTGKGASKIGIK